MTAEPATELLPLPPVGRRFTATRRVRLGDVDVEGLLRFDSVARYLQDVASDDALDAALPNAMGWVVRRTMIRTGHPCELNEHVTLTTFCTGSGRSWAERRTTINGAEGGSIEAVSLWVQIDAATGRPVRLTDDFFVCYGAAASGRTVSSKLSLPAPAGAPDVRRWQFRRTDLDPFAHINNAAQWAVFESVFESVFDTDGRIGTAELEYLAAVDLSDLDLLVDGSSAWLVLGGRVHTAMRWSASS